MIYLDLFWTFFQIGLFTIGGGQAMIPMIMTNVVNKGWMEYEALVDFIAISESTPGPFAVNIATYSGLVAAQGAGGIGVLGAMCSTLGVVLPSVIIILLIAKIFTTFMKNRAVKEVFLGVGATVTGLLASVWFSLFLTLIFGLSIANYSLVGTFNPDWISLGLFAVVMPVSFIKIKGKKFPPILLVVICALLGLLVFGLFDYFGVAV
ncbi:MAG: chromate transporter [Clostridia bacterium]|nr:chromate transporter [Clostridia bacterium]